MDYAQFLQTLFFTEIIVSEKNRALMMDAGNTIWSRLYRSAGGRRRLPREWWAFRLATMLVRGRQLSFAEAVRLLQGHRWVAFVMQDEINPYASYCGDIV